MTFPSSSRSKRVSASTTDQDMRQSLTSHGSAILALFVFLVLLSFGFALWMLKIWITQDQLVQRFPQFSPATTLAGDQLGQTENKQGLFAASLVPELFLAYQPCDALFRGSYVGNCDDYGLYREMANGSKFVIFRSLRALIPSATSSLAYPARHSYDGRYIILRMSKPPFLDVPSLQEADTVFMYDSQNGSISRIEQVVPADAVFSADNSLAVFFKQDNGDYREVVIVDLLKDEVKTVAKATRNEMFWNGVTPPVIKRFDGINVVFDVYTSSDATHSLPTLQETRTVEVE